jgi:hypothetical protein
MGSRIALSVTVLLGAISAVYFFPTAKTPSAATMSYPTDPYLSLQYNMANSE